MLLHIVTRSPDTLPVLSPQPTTLCPTSYYVNGGECSRMEGLSAVTNKTHQFNFHEVRIVLLPFSKGVNGNCLLKQAA